jgi:hypothetical protein
MWLRTLEFRMSRVVLTLVLVLAFGGSAAADGDLIASHPIDAGAAIRIQLDRGSVEVRTHDLDTARLEARARGLGASAMHFQLSQKGGDLVLTGGAESWLSWMSDGPRVSVLAWVPRSTHVEIHTAGGDIRVHGVELGVVARTGGGAIRVIDAGGRIDVQTSGGAITTRSIRGDLSAVTAGGRIDVQSIRGDVLAITSGGRIRLAQVTGDAEAHTSGGPIEIDGVDGEVTAMTSGGTILTRFNRDPVGRVETSGGAIEVAFPAGAGADLDARSLGGAVVVEHGIEAHSRTSPDHVAGAINGGGGTLRLRASGGSIHVRAP